MCVAGHDHVVDSLARRDYTSSTGWPVDEPLRLSTSRYDCRRAVTRPVVDSLAPYSVYVVNRCPPQAENFWGPVDSFGGAGSTARHVLEPGCRPGQLRMGQHMVTRRRSVLTLYSVPPQGLPGYLPGRYMHLL